MRATVWGCRGSLATPGSGTVRYGGNTSCLEVRLSDGTTVVLDAGTGITALGNARAFELGETVHLLLTHLHVDHLEGLRFFPPLWRDGTTLHIWGPPSPTRALSQLIAHYISPPLFPVSLTDAPAEVVFHDVGTEPWQIGSARVQAQPIAHPGPTVGYRIEENGHSLAYMPDHEPAFVGEIEHLAPEWISGYSLAEGASVLVHDAQLFEHEYEAKFGWGHSTVAQAVAFARAARAERLVLFHHDPAHADARLQELEERARALWGNGGPPPELAYEGMILSLGE